VAGEQPCRKESGGPSQQKDQQQLAVCLGSLEAKLPAGVHQTQHDQTVQRGDYPAVFSIGAASP